MLSLIGFCVGLEFKNCSELMLGPCLGHMQPV